MEQEGVIGNYIIEKRVGEGAFSIVYKGQERTTGRIVCLKILTKTSGPFRIADEIIYLRKLSNSNNVIQILNCFRENDQIVLVFPYFKAVDFKSFLETVELDDIRHYMRSLVQALTETKRADVIHRDVKPGNFLYCQKRKKGMLIDFGLAQKEKGTKKEEEFEVKVEKRKKSIQFFSSVVSSNISTSLKVPGYFQDDRRPPLKANRAGTRGFRAPEVLLRSSNQTHKIDMWAAGVILLVLLTRQYPFFKSTDDVDALVEIACIFGNSEMKRLAASLNRKWSSNISSIPHEKIPFEHILRKCNRNICKETILAIDLLEKMLELIPENRISPECAILHPFFQNEDDI